MSIDDVIVTDAMLEAMEQFGGGFARQLGRLYRVADPENQAKLRASFADLFRRYAEMAELRRRG